MIQSIFKSVERKQLFFWLGIFLGSIAPWFTAYAIISITEVAWMGTTTSQYEEWVELYNDGDAEVDLNGWKLIKIGNTPLFSLTGTIPSGSYYLICRSTASLTSPLGGICDEQGTFGGSGLNNTSDQLILKDDTEAVQQTLDATGGWPAGDAASKQTMQWSGTAWVTALATPGQASNTSSEDSEDEPQENTPDTPPSKPPKAVTISGEKIEKVAYDPVYEAHMIIPDFATAGVAVPMKATVKENATYDLVRGRFEWSMGDGGSYKFLKNIPIDHIFYYPGTYTVVMQYYSNFFKTEPDTIHRKIITIVPSDIVILGYSPTDGLRLKNASSKEIALDGWIIQSSNQEFVFPKYTIIPKGTILALSPKNIGITISPDSIALLNPSRELITRYSYRYSKPIVSEVEDFVEIPDPQPLSTQPPSNSLLEGGRTEPLPQSKTIADIWNQNKWYVVFGIVVLLSILAYLAFHLYAKQDELI